MADRVEVLGCGVDRLTLEQAVDRVSAWIDAGEPRRGIAVNARKLALRNRSGAVRMELATADLRIADGVAVTGAGRLAGTRFPERVTGVDLAQALLARADERGWRVALVGGRPVVAERLARDGRWTHHGYPADWGPVLRSLEAYGPDLLLVGLGSPGQEHWLREHGQAGAGFAMGVGGTLDVLAGAAERAPAWVRARGLEGAWRVGRDPVGRWRRVLDLLRMR